MNPLAQLMRARGHTVQGSDRSFDQGKNRDVAARLAALGIVVKPQDGSAVTPDLDRFVYSTAVEAETPEVRAARTHGIERVPRPALLAEVVDAGRPGVAISGTSGKSTITGMVGWLTREAGVAATVLGGAALAGEGGTGCFLPGAADGPVAAEACESDGTLTGYHAALAITARSRRSCPSSRPSPSAADGCSSTRPRRKRPRWGARWARAPTGPSRAPTRRSRSRASGRIAPPACSISPAARSRSTCPSRAGTTWRTGPPPR